MSFVLILIYSITTTYSHFVFFFQAEDGIRDWSVTGVQTCALPILRAALREAAAAGATAASLRGRRARRGARRGRDAARYRERDGGGRKAARRKGRGAQIGRASCRERGEGSGGGVW